MKIDVLMVLLCSSHGCEQELSEIRKQVEVLKTELEENLKKTKTVEATLQINQEELEVLQVRLQTIHMYRMLCSLPHRNISCTDNFSICNLSSSHF
jgi:DNA repair ATPase RecN